MGYPRGGVRFSPLLRVIGDVGVVETGQPGIQVPSNYPRGCSDTQILETVQAVSAELLRRGAQVNAVLQLSPLITIGQLELQAR